MGERCPLRGLDRVRRHPRHAPYIREGRYLYPAALDVEPQLVAAGEEAADDEIGRLRWETRAIT